MFANLSSFDKKILEAKGIRKDGKEFLAEFSHCLVEPDGEPLPLLLYVTLANAKKQRRNLSTIRSNSDR